MKSIYLKLSILLISLNSFAIELPKFEGDYKFDESALTIQQTQRNLTVVVNSDDTRNVLNGFIDDGFTCVYVVNQMYRCKKFLKDTSEDQDLRNSIINEYSAKSMQFEKSDEDYALLNDSDYLKEYEKNQNSVFVGSSFDKIHFFVLPDLVKFKIYNSQNNSNGEHFYINTTGNISKVILMSKSNKKSSNCVLEDKNSYIYEGVWKH